MHTLLADAGYSNGENYKYLEAQNDQQAISRCMANTRDTKDLPMNPNTIAGDAAKVKYATLRKSTTKRTILKTLPGQDVPIVRAAL